MLARHRRLRANIEPTLGQRLVFAGQPTDLTTRNPLSLVYKRSGKKVTAEDREHNVCGYDFWIFICTQSNADPY